MTILLLFTAYFGFSNFGFSAEYNPYAENVNILQSRAEAGDSEAQFMLGKIYYYGFGIKRNFSMAIKWFQTAANQGHASAQFLLGKDYEMGKGLQQDYKQAAKWYKQAAFQGHFLAMHSLSHLYAHGLGVPKNLIKAYAWNKLITDQGWNIGKNLKIELENIMDQEQFNQAQLLSFELKKKIREPRP